MMTSFDPFSVSDMLTDTMVVELTPRIDTAGG